MMRRFISALALLSVAACGLGNNAPTVIDGSSREAFDRSMSEARGDLGPQDRLKFEAAVTEFRAQMFAKADTRQDYQRLVREGLDGLTAVRIVQKFDENAKKAGNDAADAIFDAKRAVAGRGATAPEK
jgi:hypothetical protein